MRKEDFFTGEVLDTSPPSASENYISEAEAIQNAGFGQYDYDPGTRAMSGQSPVYIYPGGYGYSAQPQFYNLYQQPFYNYMNQPVGGYINPAFAYQQQQMQVQQQMQQQEIQSYIKPVNLFGSEYLPPMGYDEEIERLKMEYWAKEQEAIGKRSVTNNIGGYNPYTGYNYYGTPYYSPYEQSSLTLEASRKIDEMKEKAKQNRLDLNLKLASLAHNIAGHDYDEEELRERYTGKTVSAPGGFTMTYADVYNQQRFANMVPFDNSQMYRDHNARISAEYHSVIPENSNMKECFENMGILHAKYELEEEQHRRRNGAVLYNSDDNSYKFFVRAKAAERYAKNNGLPLTKAVQQQTDPLQNNAMYQFPTLAQSAKLTDDGTLNITCNFGSKAGQVYSVHNSQEASYEQDRERFQQFIDSIPGSIYLDSPNPT